METKQNYQHENFRIKKSSPLDVGIAWWTWNILQLSSAYNQWCLNSYKTLQTGFTEILQAQLLRQERLSLKLYLEYLDLSQ